MDNKGQVSMEFMISVLAVLLVFVFCLAIFAERMDLNNVSSQKWQGQNIVVALSRNINNVSLMDNNSEICDYIYWNEPDQNIYLNERSIQVFYNNAYSDSVLSTNNLVWNITDINGLICFSKRDDLVIVEYK